MEWYDDLISYLKASCSVRLWFLEKCIFQYPNLICELLLECPAADVRQAFSKLIVFLSHYALIDKDNPCNSTYDFKYFYLITFVSHQFRSQSRIIC